MNIKISSYRTNRKDNSIPIKFKGSAEINALYGKFLSGNLNEIPALIRKSVEFLPNVSQESNIEYKTANIFFRNLAQIFETANNSKIKFEEAVGDALNYAKNDDENRFFVSNIVKKHLLALSKKDSYKKFFDALNGIKPNQESNKLSNKSYTNVEDLFVQTTETSSSKKAFKIQPESEQLAPRILNSFDYLNSLDEEELISKISQVAKILKNKIDTDKNATEFKNIILNLDKNKNEIKEKGFLETLKKSMGYALNDENREFADSNFSNIVKKTKQKNIFQKALEIITPKIEQETKPKIFVEEIIGAKKQTSTSKSHDDGIKEVTDSIQEYLNKKSGEIFELSNQIKQNDAAKKDATIKLNSLKEKVARTKKQSIHLKQEKTILKLQKNIKKLLSGSKLFMEESFDAQKQYNILIALKPKRENFPNIKAYTKALRAWKKEFAEVNEINNNPNDILLKRQKVKTLRNEIKELNHKRPTLNFAKQKIEQIQRFISTSTFNNEEINTRLSGIAMKNWRKTNILEEKLTTLQQEQQALFKFAFKGEQNGAKITYKKIDYDDEFEKLQADYNERSIQNSVRYGKKRTQLIKNQAKAEKYHENLAKIKHLQTLITQEKVQNKTSLDDKTILLLENQKKRAEKIKSQYGNKLAEFLNFYVGEFIKLSESTKKINEIEQQLSKQQSVILDVINENKSLTKKLSAIEKEMQESIKPSNPEDKKAFSDAKLSKSLEILEKTTRHQ